MSTRALFTTLAELHEGGWPIPDAVTRNSYDGGYELLFRHRPGAAERWIPVFSAVGIHPPLLIPAAYCHQAFLSQSWTGTCGDLRVEIIAYLDADHSETPFVGTDLGGVR